MNMQVVFIVYAIVLALAVVISVAHGIWMICHAPALKDERLENRGDAIKEGVEFVKIICR